MLSRALVRRKIWTPAQLGSRIEGWWDFSDVENATLATGAFASATDRGSKGRNLGQGTAANQPTFTASAINSRGGASFDATNDEMTVSTVTVAQPFMVVAMLRMAGSIPDGFCCFMDGATSHSGASRAIATLKRSNASNVLGIYAGTQATFGSALSVSTNYLVGWVFNGASSIGSLDGTATTGLNPGVNGIAGGFTLGSTSSDEQMDATVGEAIIASGSGDLFALQMIEGYLAWKWGHQNSLAATHPFKSGAP
jgi:hypothetical protein